MSRDLVAAEGHYHKSCYKLFTREEFSASAGADGEHREYEESEYDEVERRAYEELFLYMRNDFLANKEVLYLTDLTSRLEKSMKSHGIAQLKLTTKKHVRRKLENELGGSLHFVSDEK